MASIPPPPALADGLPSPSLPSGSPAFSATSTLAASGPPATGSPKSSIPLPVPPAPTDFIPFEFERKDRTLVVCFDGTGDQFDQDVCLLAWKVTLQNLSQSMLTEQQCRRVPLNAAER